MIDVECNFYLFLCKYCPLYIVLVFQEICIVDKRTGKERLIQKLRRTTIKLHFRYTLLINKAKEQIILWKTEQDHGDGNLINNFYSLIEYIAGKTFSTILLHACTFTNPKISTVSLFT